MSGSINVLVKDKETGNQSVITYKAFRDTQYRFDLIGQVDDLGNLMESDPNLLPPHQRRIPEKKAADVGSGDNSYPNLQDKVEALKQSILHAVNNPTIHPTEQSFNAESIPPTSSDGTSSTGFPAKIVIEESFPDCLPASPTEPAPAADQPIKERKKPGPKPKIKE